MFFNFCRVTQLQHACDTKWAAHESTFVYCKRAVFHELHVSNRVLCVLHNSKKHTSNTSCAARKLTAILYQGIQ